MIDRIKNTAPPSPETPDVSRPRLGPGAPPVPPYRRHDQPWAEFADALRAYRVRLAREWKPSRGWTERDRQNFITQVDGAIGYADEKVRQGT